MVAGCHTCQECHPCHPVRTPVLPGPLGDIVRGLTSYSIARASRGRESVRLSACGTCPSPRHCMARRCTSPRTPNGDLREVSVRDAVLYLAGNDWLETGTFGGRTSVTLGPRARKLLEEATVAPRE